jgi:hypothetical protein
MGLKRLALQFGAHLFLQTPNYRISLLVGHEIPKGRATEKGRLVVADHGSDELRWLDLRAKKDEIAFGE